MLWSVVNIVALYIVITAILSIISGGKEYKLGKTSLRFIVGGFIAKYGRGAYPKGRPLPNYVGIALITTLFIGIALFYIYLAPRLASFIAKVVAAPTSVRTAPLIPIPLVFTQPSIVLYFLVAIGLSVVVHEIAHAIVALREGVAVRSWGIGIVLLVPIAFVELDEESFSRASAFSKLKTLCAGIAANAGLALVALAIAFALSFVASSMNIHSLVMIERVDCSICSNTSCPAQVYGLKPGYFVLYVNGTPINSFEDMSRILRSSRLGSVLVFTLCRGDGVCFNRSVKLFSYRTINGLKIPCLGVELTLVPAKIVNGRPYTSPEVSLLIEIERYLEATYVVSLSLFVLNAVPLVITDGSKALRVALSSRPRALMLLKAVEALNIAMIVVGVVFSTYVLLR